MRRNKKKRGFSDKMYYLNLKITWVFVIACFILNMLSGVLNIDNLAIIEVGIPAVFVELGLYSSFNLSKNKAENIEKLKKKYGGKRYEDEYKTDEIYEDEYEDEYEDDIDRYETLF